MVGGVLEGLFPFQEGGMGIMEPAVERMWRQVAEVFAAEFAEGEDEGLGVVDGLDGEAIGLVLVAS